MKLGTIGLAFALCVWPAFGQADSAAAHLTQGETFFAAGNFDGAIREYRRAIKLNPRDSKEHFELGRALKEKGDLDGAILEYKEAIRLEPGLADVKAGTLRIVDARRDIVAIERITGRDRMVVPDLAITLVDTLLRALPIGRVFERKSHISCDSSAAEFSRHRRSVPIARSAILRSRTVRVA